MIETVIQGVTLRADERDRVVMWASDWSRVHLLGLEVRHGGPGTYGHTDYLLPA
jgi:hypothetical protein